MLDQAGLQADARTLGRNPDAVPFIDYVSPTGDLASVAERYELVLSSDAIEHTPDLIAHLKAAGELLTPTGVYALMVPDIRYCFDHFLPPSSIAAVLQAHVGSRKVHTLASIFEHRALTTHNDPVRHWAQDHGERPDTGPGRVSTAIVEWEAAKGGYVDVHARQFTPPSFDQILTLLVRMRQIRLRPLRIYQTVRGSNEFLAILALEEPSSDTPQC